MLTGYNFKRYRDRLLRRLPDSEVYIFGHSHHAENREEEGKLFFNPGSPSIAEFPAKRLSFGIISFHPQGRVQGEIVDLTGAVLRFGRWKTGSI
jgi:predicted phosphodiesterase